MDKKKIRKELVDRLQAVINSKEGLWQAIAELTRTMPYILARNSFTERVSMEVDIIEKHLGKTEETREIRHLISSLSPSKARQSANLSAA